eukprot:s3250_g3.t1
MYAFPKITLPKGAIQAASMKHQDPDELWCLELLEQTGIVTVPGSGFGQQEDDCMDTFHFRTTILPPDEVLEDVVRKLADFQEEFNKKYSNGGGGY